MNVPSQFGCRLLRSAVLLASTVQSLCATGQTLPPPMLADGNTQQKYSTEDMQDLSLHGKRLDAAVPVPDGTATTLEFVRELYQLQWRSDDPIDVYVIRPVGVAKPPVTIYLYGYPVDENRFNNDEFCRLAVRGGYAAIGFVPALTGQRYHGVPMRMWFVSDLHDSIVKSVHDVQMMVDYVASRSDLDDGRIGIFGQGAGATIAGLAATVDSRIQAVDLLDPWGDWQDWMAGSTLVPEGERAGFLQPEYLKTIAPFDPVNWLPSLAGRRLKIDDSVYETGTPLKAKQRIDAAVPASALLAKYATKADFERDALTQGKLLSWIKQELSAQAASVASPLSGSATGAVEVSAAATAHAQAGNPSAH